MTHQEQKDLIARRMKLLEAGLRTSPKNCHEVAELVGSGYDWAYENLKKLNEIGSIYISEYRRINRVGPQTPYYAWRTNWRLQEDAPKPKPETKNDPERVKQRAKEKWARLKADPVAYAKHLADHSKWRRKVTDDTPITPKQTQPPPPPAEPTVADTENPWNNLTMRWG